jgi:ABC-type protease/lipase transport system fused ATPase/permease subunit
MTALALVALLYVLAVVDPLRSRALPALVVLAAIGGAAALLLTALGFDGGTTV